MIQLLRLVGLRLVSEFLPVQTIALKWRSAFSSSSLSQLCSFSPPFSPSFAISISDVEDEDLSFHEDLNDDPLSHLLPMRLNSTSSTEDRTNSV
ncbi:hypothetical protein Bca52824_004666 [Brassica carinata]|uniref:Uncharacterized protein n=1 Tax=Brassica carinata TaxID=52824 RepID=A0A8X7WPW7_BRACI|nr:hypothetical protein Bca52824_004666 [Brassica carinata]